MSQRLSRLTAPLTGLLFVGLTLAGVAMSNNTPSSDASGASVIAFYEAHRNSQRVSDILLVFASLFLVFFAGSLRGYLRRKPAAEAASALVPVGAALLAVGLTVVSGIDYALADVPSHLGAGAAQALNVLDNDVILHGPRRWRRVWDRKRCRDPARRDTAQMAGLGGGRARDRHDDSSVLACRHRALRLGPHRQHPDLCAHRQHHRNTNSGRGLSPRTWASVQIPSRARPQSPESC